MNSQSGNNNNNKNDGNQIRPKSAYVPIAPKQSSGLNAMRTRLITNQTVVTPGSVRMTPRSNVARGAQVQAATPQVRVMPAAPRNKVQILIRPGMATPISANPRTRMVYTPRGMPIVTGMMHQLPSMVRTSLGQTYAAPNVKGQMSLSMPSVSNSVRFSSVRPSATPMPSPLEVHKLTAKQLAYRQKCCEFLQNVLQHARNESKRKEKIVYALVQNLVNGTQDTHTFIMRMSSLLHLNPGKNLQQFLTDNMPLVRMGMYVKEITLEGIKPPLASHLVQVHPVANKVNATTNPAAAIQTTSQDNLSFKTIPNPYILQERQQMTQSFFKTQPATAVRGTEMNAAPSPPKPSSFYKNDSISEPESDEENDPHDERSPIVEKSFLKLSPLKARIRAAMEKLDCGLDEIGDGVAEMISAGVENRMKDLIEKVILTAQYRTNDVTVDEAYTTDSNVRDQIKFLRDIEIHERDRKEATQMECIFNHNQKRKLKFDDVQKKEAMWQQDANETALQALGPRKRVKYCDEVGGADMSHTMRQRVKRITMKDLKFCMEQDPELRKSERLFASYIIPN